MIRELFHIGSFSISPFGLMMVLAFLASWAVLRWGLRRLELGDEEDSSALLLAAGIGGIGGAKIYYAILYGDWHLLFDRSGLVWYGALIGGAVAVLWTIRRRKLAAWPVTDVAGPTVAIGYAVGRVGCFLVGDDYGFPTDLPWGVKFPYGLPAPTTAGFMRSEYGAVISDGVTANELIAVHPTQLYETLAGLIICVLGITLIKKRIPVGRVAIISFGLLALERFGVEFLRAKDDRILDGFTVAQVLSVAVILVLGGLWLVLRRRDARLATEAPR
ncbi:MAG: prolipoprotein diacylglyceryl transferase [bacterium]|nr:prolipoprotein diacylglyceryl transferase [bacterium]